MASLQTQIVQQTQAAAELSLMLRWARPYEDAIYRVALTLLETPEEADRVLSETVLLAWDRYVRAANQRPTLLEVMRLAVNECLAVLRGQAGDLAGWIEESDTQLGALPLTEVEWHQDPQSLFSAYEWKRIKKLALHTLTPLDRVVFLLHDVQHFSAAETAELVNKPVSAVNVRLLRARLRLREWLNPLCRATGAQPELVTSEVGSSK